MSNGQYANAGAIHELRRAQVDDHVPWVVGQAVEHTAKPRGAGAIEIAEHGDLHDVIACSNCYVERGQSRHDTLPKYLCSFDRYNQP
jgi:hypothetical protein